MKRDKDMIGWGIFFNRKYVGVIAGSMTFKSDPGWMPSIGLAFGLVRCSEYSANRHRWKFIIQLTSTWAIRIPVTGWRKGW